MVLRIDHLVEDDFTSDAARIDTARSTRLCPVELPQIDEQVFLWRAPMGTALDPITYWIGADGKVIAFATVRRFESDELDGFEAIRAWSSPVARKAGLAKVLLSAASGGKPLVSDAEGMAPVAYEAWTKVEGVRRSWFDGFKGKRCEEADIPAGEKFSRSQAARRWRLVLEFEDADATSIA